MRHVCCAIAVLIFSAASPVHAIWFETFAGGTPQQAWTYAALPSGFSFSQSYFSDGMQVGSTTAVPGGGAVAVFGVVNQVFDSSVRVRAVVNPENASGLGQNVGVLAHMDPLTASGYTFTVRYAAGQHSADLNRVVNGAPVDIGSTGVPSFSTTDTYILELDVVGTHLTGRVYDTDENLLVTLSAIDPNPFTAGVAGIVAQRVPEDPTLLGVFGMVSAVPEPASLLLVALGVLALALRSRRRHG